MSEESAIPDPAELKRLVFEAVNQRDIDTVVSFFAPDALLDGRVADELHEGRAAIRGFLDIDEARAAAERLAAERG